MIFDDINGFCLTNLISRYTYSPKGGMECASLYIKAPNSEFGNYLRFDYKDITNFSEFADSITMTSHIVNTTGSFKDIAFFTDGLKDKTEPVEIRQAEVEGPLNDFHVRNFALYYGLFTQ